MAQHRAAEQTTTRKGMPRWLRYTLLGVGAFLVAMYLYGSHLQAEQARQGVAPAAESIPTPSVTSKGTVEEPLPLPLCTQDEIRIADAAHAAGTDIRLGCEDAETLGITVPTATTTAAPSTVLVTEQPAPVTATTTAAPATVTSTEYPADVVVTEYPDHATVTSTAPQQTITEVVRPEPAHESISAADLPTCANEDGSGGTEFPCKWDPQVDGNGQGSGGIQVYTGPDQQ